jgi:PAS domain S-box-containing protein
MFSQFILKKKNPARWIATVYVVFGILWILFSDQILLMMGLDQGKLTLMQTSKGWFFVLLSGLMIFFLMYHVIENLRNVEASLLEKEQLQKNFLYKHYQPLWQTDKSGYCVFSNEKWFEFTGYILPEDKVFSWIDLVHNDDKAYCISRFSEGYISEKTFTVEYRILHRSGKYHWVINTCTPLFSATGAFDGITAYLFDINDKKHLDELYREDSRRYGYLFLNNPLPMLVFDSQDLRILEVNRAALKKYGYLEKELLSLTLNDLLPVDTKEKLENFLVDDREDLNNNHMHWKQVRKDGSMFDAEFTTHSLPFKNQRRTRLIIINDVSERVKAHESIRDAENRFKMVFENSLEGGIIVSEKLKVLNINKIACESLGFVKENVLGMRIFKIIANDSKKILNEAFCKLEKGENIGGPANLVNSAGKVFRAEWHGVRYFEDGNVRYIFFFKDVDKSFKIQSSTADSQRMHTTLISSLPGMAYRCTTNQKMLFASNGALKLTGYSAEELMEGKVVNYSDLIHPKDRNYVMDFIAKHVMEPKPYELYYRIVDRNNKIKWVWEQRQGVFDENNKLKFLEGFIIDNTREKEASELVEFQSYFLGLIIENIPFPMFYKDIQGVYLGCNKPFCDYLGKTKEEIIGHNSFHLYSKDQAEQFQEKDLELLAADQPQVYETEIIFPNGNRLNAVFHKSVFRDLDDKPLGIMGVYFDITERVKAEQIIKRQLEELARINSELERFTYTVSHDLRSPLVTIKGFLGLLREDIEDKNFEQVEDDLRRIDDATGKMQQLLEGLLELSRLGRTANVFSKVSVTQIAHEAKELLFGVIKDKNYQIIIQENMPIVYADVSLLRELFQNLIENAIKFTRNNPNPKITIYTREEADDLVFCVEDNGIGVKPMYHEKIFGLFNKLDGSTPGTGIGLSLVKRIVETHSGRIWVESEGDNMGSVFCFTLNTDEPVE